jgi:hypothetical protein
VSAVYAGLVCWLVTLILVESELFRPLRQWLELRRDLAVHGPVARDWNWRFEHAPYAVQALHPRRARRWEKARYFMCCHLCTGVWVGLALGLLLPGPLELWVLNGLLFKAVGHLALCVQKTLERWAR